MAFAVCRSAWDGVVFGFLQALAPVFLGATGPSLFSAQRGSGFYFLAALPPRNKDAGQGARQGVAVDAARLVVNEGWRVACGLFLQATRHPDVSHGPQHYLAVL